MASETDSPPWLVRRIAIFSVIALVFYVLIRFTEAIAKRIEAGHDPGSLGDILVGGAWLTLGSVIGSYIFGATWESIKLGTLGQKTSSLTSRYTGTIGYNPSMQTDNDPEAMAPVGTPATRSWE